MGLLKGAPAPAKPQQPARLRVGIFDDLTVRPLIWGIDTNVRGGTIRRASVTDIRDGLSAGELDVALLPAWDFLHSGKLQLLPGAAISTLGAANLFLLCSKVLPTEIRSVLIDQEAFGSRSLAEFLLPIQLGIRPEFVRAPAPLNPTTYDFQKDPHDAFLIVGENALMVRRSLFTWALDLSAAWHNYAKVPFVMHVWCCRHGLNLRSLDGEIANIAKANQAPPADMVQKEADRLHVDPKGMDMVFRHAIKTGCGPTEVSALRLYVKELTKAKLGRGATQFQVYRAPDATGGLRNPSY